MGGGCCYRCSRAVPCGRSCERRLVRSCGQSSALSVPAAQPVIGRLTKELSITGTSSPERSLRGPGGSRQRLAAHRGARGQARALPGRLGLAADAGRPRARFSSAPPPLWPATRPGLVPPRSPLTAVAKLPLRREVRLPRRDQLLSVQSATRRRCPPQQQSEAAEMDDEPERTKRWEGGYERTWWALLSPPCLTGERWETSPFCSINSLFYIGKFLKKMNQDRWKRPSRTFFSRQRGKGSMCRHEPANNTGLFSYKDLIVLKPGPPGWISMSACPQDVFVSLPLQWSTCLLLTCYLLIVAEKNH